MSDPLMRANSRLQWFLFRRGVIGEGELASLRIARAGELARGYYDSDEATAWRFDRATDFPRFLVRDWVIGRHEAILRCAEGQKNKLVPVRTELGDTLGTAQLSYAAACF